MERRQRENEQQMQVLLQETRRLREENNVLRIQVSSEPQHYQRMQDPCHNQEAPFSLEATHPSRRMKHGLMKPRCTLVRSDERKVQALLESRPSDNVRKYLKYLMQ